MNSDSKVVNPGAFDRLREKIRDNPKGERIYHEQVEKLESDPDERYARAGKVGRLLRTARDRRAQTQAAHAAASGMLQSEISRLERGGGAMGPTLETLVNYAHSLDMELVLVLKPRDAPLPAGLAENDDENADETSGPEADQPFLWGVF